MTAEELSKIIGTHAVAIREAYVEYLKQFPSDRVFSKFQNEDSHLNMTIWNEHFSVFGVLGYYMIDGESHMIRSIDYDTRYGHYRSGNTKYLEDLENIDDLEVATEFQGNSVN